MTIFASAGDPQPAYYLSLDPGNNTGWATFDENGNSTGYGSVHDRESVYSTLTAVQAKALIVEDFKLYPWKSTQQAWSSLETVRVLGAIEFWAYAKQCPIHFTSPTNLKIGMMWAGLRVPKGHIPDEQSAYAHGVWWLQKNGIRNPQQFRNTNV